MTINIAQLRELAQKATPGPWQANFFRNIWSAASSTDHGNDADFEFIASVNPSTIIALLDVVEAAKESCDDWTISANNKLRSAIEKLEGT